MAHDTHLVVRMKGRAAYPGVALLVILAIVVLASCGGGALSGQAQGDGEGSSGLNSVSMQLSWFPEAEHGNIFAADEGGLYKQAGLKVEAKPGGPQVSPVQIVAGGQADFGMSDADTLALARSEDVPVVAIAAQFETSPQSLMFHKSSGMEKPEEMDGKTVFVAPSANYWSYISERYDIKPEKTVAFSGTWGAFLEDKQSVTQAYTTSSPYILEEEENVQVEEFLNADLGYNPYPILFTTEKMIEKQPETVRAFVEASVEGWDNYYENTEKVNGVIRDLSPELSEELLAYTAEKERPLIYGKDARENDVGHMTAGRWETLIGQLEEVGALEEGAVNPESSYTNEFLPGSG